MAFACPRCGDRYTQSLPMVYGTGTSHRNWTSRSGYRGSTVSQSLVSALANPPRKRSIMKPLLWLVVVWFFFGGAIASTTRGMMSDSDQLHRASIINTRIHRSLRNRPPSTHRALLTEDQSREIVLIIAAIGATLSVLLIWRTATAIRFNLGSYSQLLKQWQSAFMCKACGAVFYP